MLVFGILGSMRNSLGILVCALFLALIPALSKELCFKGGWMAFGELKNQGSCIQYIFDQLT